MPLLDKKVPVLFGVFEKNLYYPTKRENKIKISKISVYFTFCWFVGIKEKNIRRSIGKNFSSPWRETAGRKDILICLVSEKRAETAVSIALLVEAGKAKTPAGIVVLADAAESVTFLEQDSTTVPKFAYPLILPLRESCWGVPSPNPALRLAPLIPPLSCGNRKEVIPCERNTTRPTAAMW